MTDLIERSADRAVVLQDVTDAIADRLSWAIIAHPENAPLSAALEKVLANVKTLPTASPWKPASQEPHDDRVVYMIRKGQTLWRAFYAKFDGADWLQRCNEAGLFLVLHEDMSGYVWTELPPTQGDGS